MGTKLGLADHSKGSPDPDNGRPIPLLAGRTGHGGKSASEDGGGVSVLPFAPFKKHIARTRSGEGVRMLHNYGNFNT